MFIKILSILVLSFVGMQAQAVKMKNRKLANEQNSSVTVLSKLNDCVNNSVTEGSFKACANDKIASGLAPAERVRILLWFRSPFELSEPVACDSASLQFIPQEKMKNVAEVLCAKYSNEVSIRQAMFFFVNEGSSRRLVNIKDDFVGLK